MNTTETQDPARFDVREIPCSIKHGLIFKRWEALRPGEHFVLVNDHDPVPLYYQFSAQFNDAVGWEYEQRGPDVFAVRITKRAACDPLSPEEIAAKRCGNHDAEAKADPRVEVDARGLEPPQPIVRIMEAVEKLAVGRTLRALTDRRPVHLLTELQARKFGVISEEQPDGSWLTLIQRN